MYKNNSTQSDLEFKFVGGLNIIYGLISDFVQQEVDNLEQKLDVIDKLLRTQSKYSLGSRDSRRLFSDA